jgi:hypothetical protein
LLGIFYACETRRERYKILKPREAHKTHEKAERQHRPKETIELIMQSQRTLENRRLRRLFTRLESSKRDLNAYGGDFARATRKFHHTKNVVLEVLARL